MLKQALELAALGIAVFPLSPGSKIPIKGTNGVKDATTDPDKIRTMWLQNRGCNVGVALGAVSGIVGVDLDYNHGATDEDLHAFPQTITVKTRNGYHLYYKYSAGIKNQVLIPARNGLGDKDKAGAAYLRSDGYYLVGPGSGVSHDKGKYLGTNFIYKFHEEGIKHDFSQLALLELPASFLTAPTQPPVSVVDGNPPPAALTWKPIDKAETVPPAVGEGGLSYPPNTRHAMLLRTATAMRKKGHSAAEISKILHERNLKDCKPPKTPDEGIDKEIANMVAWVDANVKPAPIAVPDDAGDFLMPLGHLGSDYYYTSSSNRQIVRMSVSAHTNTNLMNLMPGSWWQQRYPAPNGQGAAWGQAISDLMEMSREVGIFDEKKMRGLGCWQDDGKLVLHLGDRLLIDGQEKALNASCGKHIYALNPNIEPPHHSPLTTEEGRQLLDVSESLSWKDKQSGIFLAGALATLRLCGALPWRPMMWLTGPSGSGKSTVMEQVVNRIAGSHGVYILGNTTEAGIRQELGSNAQPVIFDEAETNDKRSANRMKAVLELIRQASSDSDGRILKGTADGRGHNFKISSSFFLASIRYNLTEEADKNRFTVLELERNDPKKWPEIKRKIDAITIEYGDKLFARAVRFYPTLMESRGILEERIAARHSRRTAQQYGILLAGYWLLRSDNAISQIEADELIKRVRLERVTGDEAEDSKDEIQALENIIAQERMVKHLGERDMMTVSTMIKLAGNDDAIRGNLKAIGLDRDDKHLYVAIRHPMVNRLFAGTKWEDSYATTLGRLPLTTGVRHRFEARKLNALRIPLSVVFPSDADAQATVG